MDYKISQASQDVHHPQPHVGPSYSYLPNRNPNPNPTLGLDNSTPSADPGAFLLPATDPYSVHGGGYEGFLAGSYTYVEAAAQAAEAAAQAAEAATGAAEGMRKFVKAMKNFEGLEIKKQKIIQGGAAADSVRVCTVCNVVCNSDIVFASHLASEKHAMKALKKTPPKVVQSVYCEVCMIDCNSQEVLNNHKLGKKHKRNLQKLQETIAPKSMNVPVITAGMENVATDKGRVVDVQTKRMPVLASKQDLETEERKVLEGEASANAVGVCSLSNVVCNSQEVFDLHVSGQKNVLPL